MIILSKTYIDAVGPYTNSAYTDICCHSTYTSICKYFCIYQYMQKYLYIYFIEDTSVKIFNYKKLALFEVFVS